jgi:hypothetical protein
MSDNRAWRTSSRSYNEIAISLVRRCVAFLRRPSKNTEDALRELAPELLSTPRRMRTLFYADGTPHVTEGEMDTLRRRYAMFFLGLEAKHLELAAQCRAEAEAPLYEQMEFSWGKKVCNENSSRRGSSAIA